ncbi:hypothetical protein ACJ73_08097 [Blastomyces percursus]|uniref:GED domain-containing protein n=1 Tax=Blastomyces percursus TaxID=1658174 RepID=A0A1J9QWK5_9EURO|nr:hypothetical protein ACJ73_08097 [Blastomyces percursus]
MTVSYHDAGSSDLTGVMNASIEALQSSEQRELLDLVDRLRRAGLSSVLQLPQIVVCGDQSSGKSSVLEALTEIPFPRKENLCTRFATEIIMRREAESSIQCKINPDNERPEEEQLRLRTFGRSINDFAELPSLMDVVTEEMGLNERKAFCKDVLSIEICGPNRPQLTIVDLPGLIHSANKSQSEEDVELIKSLVQHYISQVRTIMLAVVSAKNDYANQVILKLCRKFDPKGARTLGVITKPDYLRPGSDYQREWLELAHNRDIYFELGWHLLKNRSDDEHHLSFTQRNLNERLFFNSGNYTTLPKHMKGIDSLRERLSRLLFEHLKHELPNLKTELDTMAEVVCMELQDLGRSRPTLADQRAYLADFFGSAYDIVVAALNGNYDHPFFGGLSFFAADKKKEKPRRLRAAVQRLNIQFAKHMHQHGHQYIVQKIDANKDLSSESIEASSPEQPISKKSKILSRNEAIQMVVNMLEQCRGRELPGTFNPMLISHLFWEQSKDWESIAHDHLTKVAAACKTFLLQVLDHVASSELKKGLLNLTVLPALTLASQAALKELENIVKDKSGQPITYNHYFTDTWQKMQEERAIRHIRSLAQEATVDVSEKTWTGGPGYQTKKYIDPTSFDNKLGQTIQQDMDKFSAEQALDAHDAYYKSEKKFFIDVVAKQVIERHLVSPLAEVFSPKVLARYSDKEIHLLASERPEVVQMREHLESRCKMLKDGQDAFNTAMGQSIIWWKKI